MRKEIYRGYEVVKGRGGGVKGSWETARFNFTVSEGFVDLYLNKYIK